MIESIDWTQVILALVSAVLVPVVSTAVAAFNTWMKAKAEQVKEQTSKDTLDKYVDLAQALTTEIVNYLNTTLVNDMKIASEDGRLTEDEALEIMEKAKAEVLSKISDTGKLALETAFGDLDALLEVWITNATQRAKTEMCGTGIDSTTARKIAAENLMNPTPEDDEAFDAGEAAASLAYDAEEIAGTMIAEDCEGPAEHE